LGDPYYPVPRAENNDLYKKYKALADAATGVHFVGKLATYKYYNMDQVVAQALSVFHKIVATEETDISESTDELDTPLAPVS
jgi:UDP-galactopyranose mutase